MNHRRILAACFALSLVLHVLSAIFLQRYSFWFSSSQPKEEPSTHWLNLVDKKEKDQILKTTFEPNSQAKSEPAKAQKPQQEAASALAFRSYIHLPEPEVFPFSSNENVLLIHKFLSLNPTAPSFSHFSEPIDLLNHLPKELIIPPSSKHFPSFSPIPAQSELSLSAAPPKLEQETSTAPISYSESPYSSLIETVQIGKAPPMIPVPHLPKFPTLDELETSSYSDFFDVELVFIPREDKEGYVFALTLIPHADLQLPKLHQRITFLIDRSNSIQQGRLTATKAAIHKSLEDLCAQDTFNIIAFDSKMEKMSPSFLPCIGRSFALAEAFLEKMQLGSFFSSSDLYKPLFLTVPSEIQNDEIYTAILLTDGESLTKRGMQRSLLHDWTQYNRGKVALYVLGMNGDPHSASLDVAAVFNKGRLSHAPTNRGLKRKLRKLLKTISYPIAKNLSCKAISRSPHAELSLFSTQAQMSHLYLDQPYVILGETDTLDDFILFLQGRLKDRWLNIKKSVSFLNAKKGNKALKEEWALQRAYALYERYFFENDPKLIAEARDLLEPFERPVALQ